MAMPLLAEPIDFAGGGIEGGEQGGCAIAFESCVMVVRPIFDSFVEKHGSKFAV